MGLAPPLADALPFWGRGKDFGISRRLYRAVRVVKNKRGLAGYVKLAYTLNTLAGNIYP
jgi:hypothetical protein